MQAFDTMSLLRPDVRLTPYDTSRWVVSTASGRSFLVNAPTARLVRVLGESGGWEGARRGFCEALGQDIGAEAFRGLVQQKLGGLEILREDDAPVRPPRESYLRLRLPLIPPRLAGWLAGPLSLLYAPGVFWATFAAALAVSTAAAVFTLQEMRMLLGTADVLLVPPLIVGAMILHELGHVAACRAYGVRHGAIGVGFYFLMPVMYADISGVWALEKHRRIIANLGGLFGELLYATALAAGYLATGQAALLLAAAAVTTSSVYQLIPFVRRDGYWVLSDAAGVPNLMLRSREAVRRVFGRIRRRDPAAAPLAGRDVWLAAYGLANVVMLAAFVSVVLLAHPDTLLTLPAYASYVAGSVAAGTLTMNDFQAEYVLAVAFYGLALRFVIFRGLRALRSAEPAR